MSPDSNFAERADSSPKNTQSDDRTRTHLANERTFFSWLRTGITTIALGLAAARFLAVEQQARSVLIEVLAYVLIVGGIGLAAAGAWRYVRNGHRIDEGQFRPSPGLIVGAATLGVSFGLLAIILVGRLR